MPDAKITKTSAPVVHENEPAGVVAKPGPITGDQAMDKWIRDAATVGTDVGGDAHERIIRQVLSADSPDAVLTPVDALQAKDMIDVTLILLDFDLNESEYDEGSPFYASMQVLLPPDGERAVVNCGHKKVIAQLVKLREFDQFPYHVKVRARGTSSVGTPMLELTKWSADEERQFAEAPEPPPF